VSQPSAPPPPYRYARHVFLSVSAIAVAAIVVVGRAILLPFLMAALTAYVLFPLVKRAERPRFPRWAAILVVYTITIGALTAFSWAVVPRLFDEVKSLATDLPRLTKRIRDDWLPSIDARLQRWSGATPKPSSPKPQPTSTPTTQPAPIVVVPRQDGSFEIHVRSELQVRENRDGSWSLVPKKAPERKTFSSAEALRDAFDKAISYAQTNSLELLKVGRQIVSGVSRGVFYFFITLMLAGYMMFSYERIHGFVRGLWPSYRRSAFDLFLSRLDKGLAGVVRGQLLICLVNGVLTAIGLWIFDLKYWPILSLIAALMSIIPIFGSILSTIPCVAIGLTQGFGTAIGVLVWIIGIHQLEANFLNPKIIGDQAKIHPVLVVFALLLGEHFFHITGALLAVPCLALVQTVFLHFRESILGLPPTSGDELDETVDDERGAPPTEATRAAKDRKATPPPVVKVESAAATPVKVGRVRDDRLVKTMESLE